MTSHWKNDFIPISFMSIIKKNKSVNMFYCMPFIRVCMLWRMGQYVLTRAELILGFRKINISLIWGWVLCFSLHLSYVHYSDGLFDVHTCVKQAYCLSLFTLGSVIYNCFLHSKEHSTKTFTLNALNSSR